MGSTGKTVKEITSANLAPLGTLSKDEYRRNTGEDDGLSSADGKLKHITLYHASFSDFDEFDFDKGKEAKGGGADMYGEGFYFTSNPNVARMFGNILYTVDVAYSTNNYIAKKTGREKDFQYDPETGYWVIPKNKAKNLKIKKKEHID